MNGPRTFSGAVAEGALEASASVNERHVRAHVCLTSIAPDRAELSKVNNWWLVLQR